MTWYQEGPTLTGDAGLGDRSAWGEETKRPRPNGGRQQQHARLRVLSIDDLLNALPRDYIVKGWMAPGEISLIVGAKNARKSFFALHAAYAISLGRTVFGRRAKQASILYIVCEGEKGISKRVRALVRRYGKSIAFHVIAQPVDLLHRTRTADDLKEIIATVKEHNVGVVFVDTVARVMPGGRENSPEDMSTLLHNLNILRYETGAHIAGVHHGTQDDGTKSRGHSNLPNGADVILQVEWAGTDEGIGTATIGFARDDRTGILGGFTAEEITLGIDDDGDDVTTLLINELEPSQVSPIGPRARNAAQPRPLTAEQETMLAVARSAITTAGEPLEPRPGEPLVRAITRLGLRERLIEDGWFAEDLLSKADDGSPKLARGGFSAENNKLRALKTRKFLVFNREYVWLP